ncbi:MAG: tyrosine-type recombinase/integrase [Clostridium sp.]
MNEIILVNNKSNIATNKIFNNKHFIKAFLEIKANRSINTAKSYERDIKDFFNVDNVEKITLDQIKSVNIFHAQNYILFLSEEGLASATINRKISSLSALYKWLLKFKDNYTESEIIKYNPFAALKEEKPVVNNKDTEFLTGDECKAIMESIDGNDIIDIRNKAIMALALTTALRKSEMLNIKLKDISKYGEYDVIIVKRKGNKKDVVKLQRSVLTYIEEYLSATNRDKIANREEYLFLGHSKNSIGKEKLDPSSLNYIIKKICEKAGINKKIKVHSTRHTAITLAITKGVTIEKVREFAGHKNIATTNRYIHSIDKLKNNAGDVIDIF